MVGRSAYASEDQVVCSALKESDLLSVCEASQDGINHGALIVCTQKARAI